MCGIAGVFRLSGLIGPVDTQAVKRMTAAQTHRGPDDEGFFHDDVAALGHRRLSIIDLSRAARQPIGDESGAVWTVCNGEIYNYRELRRELLPNHQFRSATDPEVLVHGWHEWGPEGLLQRISGMFALGLYDSRTRTLMLARDPFGIKPLYYAADASSSRLAFASEAQALEAGGFADGGVDMDGVAGFLLLGSTPSPVTILKGVSCLQPGHYLICSAGGYEVRKYWKPDRFSGDNNSLGGLSNALHEAVALHLNSDVPVGLFLSGGVDSTALVALASRVRSDITTLTVALDDAEIDEAGDARETARHFRTEHKEVTVTSRDLAQTFRRYVKAMDQPTVDGLNTFCISEAARRVGLKVVLSGLGGDEVFRGYRHYKWLERNRRIFRLAAMAPKWARRGGARGAKLYGRLSGQEKWSRLDSVSSEVTSCNIYAAVRGFFPTGDVSRLTGIAESRLREFIVEHLTSEEDVELADGFNAIEIKRYLHDQLLRDTDVFSMAQSVEVRVPYLDPGVVTQALRVQQMNHCERGINKFALVSAVGDAMVEKAARRQKKGFSLPIARWMKETPALRSCVETNRDIDASYACNLWDRFDRGRLHWSRAMALVVLGARNARY